MGRITTIILLVSVARTHADESGVTHGAEIETFLDRAVKPPFQKRCPRQGWLDHSILGKSGSLAALPSTSGPSSRLAAARFELRGSQPRRACHRISYSTRCADVAPVPVEATTISRRQAGLAALVSGLAAATAPLQPALAKKGPPKPLIESLSYKEAGTAVCDKDGPGGIKYAELKPGKGPSPAEGDLVKVNYILRLAATDEQVDVDKFFQFELGSNEVVKGYEIAVLGGGDMPPMKVGGTRKLIIPPELGYGKRGAGCGRDDQGQFPAKMAGPGVEVEFDANACVIPGDSVLEFRVELVSIKGV